MWKWIAIGMGVLVVLVGIGIIVLQEYGLAWFLKPDAEFSETVPAAAPDYADPASWAAMPGRDDAADALPEGVSAVPEAQRVADVFFIHPTSYLTGETWNADVADQELNMLTDQLSIKGQATAFNGCCRIWAPRYRQATLYTFFDDAPSNLGAIDLAYQDVARAFDYFVGTIEPGRPIILASHSQGSHHLNRLLAERISGTALADRVVAVYMIGFGLPLEAMQNNAPDFPACAAPDDTGCVIHWDTFRQDGNPEASARGLPKWNGGAYRTAEDPAQLCVNPLTWTDAKGTKDQHAGALRMDSSAFNGIFQGSKVPPLGTESTLADIAPNLTDAWCYEGILYVTDTDDPIFEAGRMPGGSLHLIDYGLFWKDIYDNASVRVNAYVAKRAQALQ